MAFNEIKNLLKKNIGLHADTVGVSSIERAIGHRMDHLGVESESSYYSLIKEDSKEFAELVEEVVVPETWFFRNRSPFEALSECASELGRIDGKLGAREPLKILSIPCATGEEPYSIAMALRTAGLAEGDFHIDGVDVSKRALTKAKRAIYGQHSFREDNVSIQDKYFKKTRSGFQVIPGIKQHVSFKKANIISDAIAPSNEHYDIIFCRNLLIYFGRETQSLVLDKLRLMLKEGGFLFVGHAETTQVKNESFTKVDIPKSFAYQKTSSSGMDAKDVGAVDKLRNIYDQLVEVARKDLILSNKIKQPNDLKNKRVMPVLSVNHSWGKVEKLIGSGHFDDATSVCESLIEGEPENADGYYSFGLMNELCGSVGSEECFLEKAIDF